MNAETLSGSRAEKSLSMSYNFSEDEVRLLAKCLRKFQNELPAGLDRFARQVELTIYSNMTIGEVEKFYS